MTKEKPTNDEVKKIIENKREKAQQKQQDKLPPNARQLTPQEKAFVDQWCLGMRGVDQAMFILQLHDVVHNLAQRVAGQDKQNGLFGPDGSKL